MISPKLDLMTIGMGQTVFLPAPFVLICDII